MKEFPKKRILKIDNILGNNAHYTSACGLELTINFVLNIIGIELAMKLVTRHQLDELHKDLFDSKTKYILQNMYGCS